MKYTYQCPRCHVDLNENNEPIALECSHCYLKFPIEDGIPVLIINEAIKE